MENWSEDKLQAECFKWFWNTYPDLRRLLFAVPNGGNRDIREAVKLKATGTVPGIPDLVFCFRRNTWFFELKKPTAIQDNPELKGGYYERYILDDEINPKPDRRLSDEQIDIHSKLRAQGFIVWVLNDLDRFKELITAIIRESDITKPKASGMIKQREFEYRHSIFQYLWNDLAEDPILLDDLVEDERRAKFVHYVECFIEGGFDKENGIEVLFTEDRKAIYSKPFDFKDFLEDTAKNKSKKQLEAFTG